MDQQSTAKARKRQSLQAPLGPTATSPVQIRSHRRAVSSGDAAFLKGSKGGSGGGVGGIRTSEVMRAHKRLSSVTDARSVRSDGFQRLHLPTAASTGEAERENGRCPDGVDDLDAVGVAVDRLRAPTRSTLNKQRRSISSSNAMPDTQRRAATPGDVQDSGREALGLGHIPRAAVSYAVSMHGNSPRSPRSPYGQVDEDGDGLTTPVTGDELSPMAAMQGLSPLGKGREPLAHVSNTHGSRNPSGSHGKSTRMIAALQAELENTRAHLDRVKQEVRNCRREIGTLTRKSDDLRETRERMRAEAETQQNIIQRRERIIAEMLARARAAEAAVSQHVAERKELDAMLKKTIAESRTGVAEATLARAKAESERDALRDSVRSLRNAWAREVTAYRDEFDRTQQQAKQEREEAAAQHAALMSAVRAQAEDHKGVATLVEEVNAQHREASEHFEAEVQSLRAEVDKHSKDAAEARETAKRLAMELARLRRFAQLAPREDLDDAAIASEFGATAGESTTVETLEPPEEPGIPGPVVTPA